MRTPGHEAHDALIALDIVEAMGGRMDSAAFVDALIARWGALGAVFALDLVFAGVLYACPAGHIHMTAMGRDFRTWLAAGGQNHPRRAGARRRRKDGVAMLTAAIIALGVCGFAGICRILWVVRDESSQAMELASYIELHGLTADFKRWRANEPVAGLDDVERELADRLDAEPYASVIVDVDGWKLTGAGS